jgi:hypothetical protein
MGYKNAVRRFSVELGGACKKLAHLSPWNLPEHAPSALLLLRWRLDFGALGFA